MPGFVYDAKFRGARETSNVLKTAIDSRRKRTDFYFQMVHLEYKQLSDLKNHGYEKSQWFKVDVAVNLSKLKLCRSCNTLPYFEICSVLANSDHC